MPNNLGEKTEFMYRHAESPYLPYGEENFVGVQIYLIGKPPIYNNSNFNVRALKEGDSQVYEVRITPQEYTEMYKNLTPVGKAILLIGTTAAIVGIAAAVGGGGGGGSSDHHTQPTQDQNNSGTSNGILLEEVELQILEVVGMVVGVI